MHLHIHHHYDPPPPDSDEVEQQRRVLVALVEDVAALGETLRYCVATLDAVKAASASAVAALATVTHSLTVHVADPPDHGANGHG